MPVRLEKIVSAAGFAMVLLAPAGAEAQFKVCNQTLNLYNVAIGIVVAEGAVETEGWWTLAANSCVTPIKEPLGNRYYYLYASNIYGDDAVTGKTDLCVKYKQPFRNLKTDPLRPGCWLKGLIQVKFKEIDTKGYPVTSWTVFIEAQGEGE